MKKTFDAKFYIEVLTGDLKHLAHPKHDADRKIISPFKCGNANSVEIAAFEDAKETIETLAANTDIAYYKILAEDISGSTLFDREFAYGVLKDMGRKIRNKELKLPTE